MQDFCCVENVKLNILVEYLIKLYCYNFTFRNSFYILEFVNLYSVYVQLGLLFQRQRSNCHLLLSLPVG